MKFGSVSGQILRIGRVLSLTTFDLNLESGAAEPPVALKGDFH